MLNYTTVAELMSKLSEVDPRLPIKIVVTDQAGNPYCDSVLERGNFTLEQSNNALIGRDCYQKVVLLTCLSLDY
jgi:hypothetical protein